jgi:DNA-binding NarL/FixJ family response regulator
MLVRARLGLEVIGEAGDSEELIYLVEAKQPDLVLLDDDLPGVGLADLIPTLRGLDLPPAVIVLNEQPETEEVALAAGADAFVYKGDHPKQLLIAIESIRLERQGE